jgi:Tol biopolymer transport system component
METSGSLETPLWSIPLPAGSPRRVGNIVASSAAWSRDGQLLVFIKGTDLFLANADGAATRLLAKAPGPAAAPSFSPDGSRIRFSTIDNVNSLWEVRADGSNLHSLLPDWHGAPSVCCGKWTPDGHYYLFEGFNGSGNDIFALQDSGSIFRKASTQPTRLTTGPLMYNTIAPDVTGRRVFVQGVQPRGELVRYDRSTKQFLPFLQGISATDVAFSRDGKWVAYVTVPSLTLWRSRVDGSERVQLTYPPSAATLPVWSPDGSQIAYISIELGKPWKIFLISAEGGSPEELLTENVSEVDASWSPDGAQLAFGRASTFSAITKDIQLVDVKSRKLSTVPGSAGLFSPRWSPDGRYLAAISVEGSHKLMLYDFHAQKWTEWLTDASALGYPDWSADSRYIYFDDLSIENRSVKRLHLGQNRAEDLFSTNGLPLYSGVWGTWSGLTPDNSRLFLKDTSTQDIYALDLDLP